MAVVPTANALCSVADVKYVWARGQSDVSQDDRIQKLINMLSGRVEDWCGRKFTYALYSDTSGDFPAEIHDAPRLPELFARQYPISKVNSLVINAVNGAQSITVDVNDYIFYPEEGRIYYPKGWWQGATIFGWHRAVALDYNAGYKNPYNGIAGGGYSLATVPAATVPTLPTGLSESLIEWIIILLEGRMKDAKVKSEDVQLAVPNAIAIGLQPYKRMDF